MLDDTYRAHGFGRVLEDLNQAVRGPLNDDIVDKLREIARFMVYGKHHVLCQERTEIDKIILIKSGWVRRIRGVPLDPTSTGIVAGAGESIGVDFLGAGNCLDLEGASGAETWKYSASVMARTEVLEIPIGPLAANTELRDRVIKAFSDFSSADDSPPAIELVSDLRALAAAPRTACAACHNGRIEPGTNRVLIPKDKADCTSCHVQHFKDKRHWNPSLMVLDGAIGSQKHLDFWG